MKGFLAWDATKEGPRPGVLVIHEWWGHNAYARHRAVMLAQLGYTALAVDMYGDGKTADHPGDAMKFAQATTANLDEAKARFDAAKQLLAERAETDGTKVAAIGYCFGGGIALNMARMGEELAGVVSFHGSLGAKTPAEKGAVKTEILVLNGGDDPLAPADAVKAFEDEMTAAGATFEVVSYPGAKHAFTNPGATAMGQKFELPLAYDAKADAASWDAMKAFLARVFAK
ncbi:MAG: dienelactone hydrolase family protein [Deltaproteobacteria bacterium]|nr:MAG: dienelactone hydrolase family protein [Deltaproteobacteria bacterium]